MESFQRSSQSVAVIGAGIMGRLIAWRLTHSGCNVSLFDKDSFNASDAESYSAAAYTAAGMLTPFSEVEKAELEIHQLGLQSIKLWQQYSEILDKNIGLRTEGTLVVAHQQDNVELERFKQLIQVNLPQSVSSGEVSPLNQEQLCSKEPELAGQFASALFIDSEACLDSHAVMEGLLESMKDTMKDAQVKLYPNHKVNQIVSNTVMTDKFSDDFDWVVDCRGLGAKNDIPELRAVRGELIWVKAPDVQLKHMVRLMHPRYRLYVVPRPDNVYIIGATQIESDDDGAISVRSALELLSALYSMHPGFAEAKVIDIKTNCRPALPDNLPKIEVTDKLIRVNGLFRHGFLVSPALAEQVVGMICAAQHCARIDQAIVLKSNRLKKP